MTAFAVIDTNLVLDLLVYGDPLSKRLRDALDGHSLHWISTQPMRDELKRVLGYPHIVKRLGWVGEAEAGAADVLRAFDAQATLVPVAAKAPFTCKDADDQGFIDLACAHKALLFSKDKAVLCMQKRLEKLGVKVQRHLA